MAIQLSTPPLRLKISHKDEINRDIIGFRQNRGEPQIQLKSDVLREECSGRATSHEILLSPKSYDIRPGRSSNHNQTAASHAQAVNRCCISGCLHRSWRKDVPQYSYCSAHTNGHYALILVFEVFIDSFCESTPAASM